MRIEKVFNNNVVLAKANDQSEMIVMGKGIGFQKKVGDTFEEERIDKKFVIQEDDPAQRLKEIYQDIPVEESDAVFIIISLAEQKLQQTFDPNVYLTLADHIHYALQRKKEGIQLKNPLAWEVKKFYRREYELGKESLSVIKTHTHTQLDNDEAASIALHFVNAQKEGQLIEETIRVTRIVQDILNIVRLHFGITFDEESISYNRFLTHLQYFAQRVVLGELYQSSQDTFLLEQIKANYPGSYTCTSKIAIYIEESYHFNISPDEKVYLSIHIHRVVNQN
ncbi:BglG family transcription antiterminator LicT [Pisciglobus halotolerans]|uniref:Transcriptional antiterminator, BglG family n=1 Tax=Pisciglobus halotolerans TaxID=745365 RepID=A0A1I3CC83_9LACT|nr:PRD domain-containing protein [Pisciglobus halotolerans]SFH72142.1 transcriptional antiterminator, BglG family [Pisciglobus halotolerans]